MRSYLSVFILAFVAASLNAESTSSTVKVAVELFPVGSFTITTHELQGKALKVGTTLQSDEISVPVSSLDTGIKLRTTHMQEKLKASEYPLIRATQLSGQDGKGKAQLTIMQITRPITFTYQLLEKQRAQASFKLTLSDFDLRGINYLGIGVQDEVEVSVTMPIQEK
jgi:polyisoprenoid-binding protein YceI